MQFEKRCEARQNEIRDGSVLAHVTKRIAAITPPRALVVLRFLLNNPQRTVCFWPYYTILFHTYTDIRSAETGEIFGLEQPRFDKAVVAPIGWIALFEPDNDVIDQIDLHGLGSVPELSGYGDI